ncbi:MAG TPA: heat-inducible transcriptional repressor HrcA [Chloroflexota bacterium]|nr:heat-inducible transcriptional repressor HrcA [Chloroflexota bacterium]
MSLSERQSRILAALVEVYVTSGRPMGSSAILLHSGLVVSSATVRSELALLEDMGYVAQLHTSGGRIPTTRGYRYYVEHLLPMTPLSERDQLTIRHQFHQAEMEIEESLKLAAAVMARRAHNVALVTSPRVQGSGFKHVELIEAHPQGVLVVVVLADGTAVQETVAAPWIQPQEMLRGYADLLNSVFPQGARARTIQRRTADLPPELQPYAHAVIRLMGRAQEGRRAVFHEGLSEMLSRRDFSSRAGGLGAAERLKRVVDFLEQGLPMDDLLSVLAMENGIHVLIGGEPPLDELEDYSIVVGSYGGGGERSGVLGLLGPTPMEYGGAISLVRYMSELMTDLMVGY